MENNNYSYTSYPESGDSSPRSREIDFENPSPWDDPNYKVKFMCSFGGKIHPRPHDNQLAYISGETKILSVDRSIRFSLLISKLSAICDSDNVSFKYQLPGEDLDALITVTNDDDLEHMMHEYDRLYRASPKPARLRLFLFPVVLNPPTLGTGSGQARSFNSEDSKSSEKERFVEALNSVPPIHAPIANPAVAPPVASNADFLFGSEKVKLRDPIAEQAVKEPEVPVPVPCIDDRMIGNNDPIQKHIQDLQRLHLEEQQNMYRRKSDDSFAGAGGEYYTQKLPEKVGPANVPGTVTAPVGYRPENKVNGGVLPASNNLGTEQQQVYMIQTPGGAYHAPLVRPMAGPGPGPPQGQGYYAFQRMQPETYRDQQQMYNVIPNVQQPQHPGTTLQSQGGQNNMGGGYSDGFGMVRPAATTMGDGGYTQMGYDGAGRQVYYHTPSGGVFAPPPQQPQPPQQHQYSAPAPAGVVNSDMRTTGALNQDSRGW